MSEITFQIPGQCGHIRGEVRLPSEPKGTVVICHGFKGFSHWGFFPYLADQAAAASLTAISFDFSGSGIGADRLNVTEPERFFENTFVKELTDLDIVLDHSRKKKWITGKFGLFGHSRGGGVAILHSASDKNVGALVTWSSIGHLRLWAASDAKAWRDRGYTEVVNSRTGQVLKIGTELLDEVETLADTRLNIEEAAARVAVPWLIVHGKGDETVPAAEAELLHKKSIENSTLHIVDGNHGFGARHPLVEIPGELRAVTAETVSFFKKHLAG